MLTGFDTTTTGHKEVTVTHEGATTTFDILVFAEDLEDGNEESFNIYVNDALVQSTDTSVTTTNGKINQPFVIKYELGGVEIPSKFITWIEGNNGVMQCSDGIAKGVTSGDGVVAIDFTYTRGDENYRFVTAVYFAISDEVYVEPISIESVEYNSSTDKVVVTPGTDATYEYGYSSTNDYTTVSNWQSSNEFDPMADGTYYFFGKVDTQYTEGVEFVADGMLPDNTVYFWLDGELYSGQAIEMLEGQALSAKFIFRGEEIPFEDMLFELPGIGIPAASQGVISFVDGTLKANKPGTGFIIYGYELPDGDTYKHISSNVTVIGSDIEALHIQGAKTNYTVGDEFVAQGTIFASYNSGVYEPVDLTADYISGFDTTTPGTKEVTVTYKGYTTTYEIVVEEAATITSIAVSDVKTDYTVGDEFVAQGNIVISYGSEATESISLTADYISGFDTATAGTKEITVTYEGFTTTYEIVVEEVAPSKVVIDSVELLISSVNTVRVTATGDDGTRLYGYSTTNDPDTVTNWKESSSFNDLDSGDYYFFAKYQEDDANEYISDGYSYTVDLDTTETIYLWLDGVRYLGQDIEMVVGQALEAKFTYKGEEIPFEDMLFELDYWLGDPSRKDIVSFVDGTLTANSAGTGWFIYGYEIPGSGSTSSYVADGIIVTEATIESLEISGVKTEYTVGDAFVAQGTILAGYNNGLGEQISLTEDHISGFDTTTAGTKEVTVTYGGLTTTFEITVVPNTSDTKDVAVSIKVDDPDKWTKYKVVNITGSPAENTQSLTTPSGVVTGNTTSFLITEIGTYTFAANSIDNYTTDSKQVTITKIDNEKPIIIIGYNEDWSSVIINATDNGEIDKVVLPGGEEYTASELPIVLPVEGITVGTVTAYDQAGNIASKDFNIANGSTGSGSGSGDAESYLFVTFGTTGISGEWTNQDLDIGVYGLSNAGAINLLSIEDGDGGDLAANSDVTNYSDEDSFYVRESTFSIYENGTYAYSGSNAAGSYSDIFEVNNIDKEAPTVTLATNGTLLNIYASDNLSGVKLFDVPTLSPVYMEADQQGVTSPLRRQLDLAKIVDGEYTITITDYAGNKTLTTFTVDNGALIEDNTEHDTVPSVSVIFDMNKANTGVTASTVVKQVELGESCTVIPLDNAFMPEGMRFSSWNTAPDGSGTNYNANDEIVGVSDNVVLYLITEAISYNTVTIHGNNSGASDYTTEVETGTSYTLPSVAVSSNLVFLGFSDTANGTVKYTSGSKLTVDNNVELYVITKTKEYTVKINSNGSGATDIVSTVKHGGTYTIPSITVSSTKELQGLAETSTGTVKYKVGDTLTVTSNIELYVITTNKNTSTGGSSGGSSGGSTSGRPVKYYIEVYDDIENGDVDTNKRMAYSGDTVTITVDPDKGYELTYIEVTDSRGNNVKLTEKSDSKFTFRMPSRDVEVYARFSKRTEDVDSDTNTDDDTDKDSSTGIGTGTGTGTGTSSGSNSGTYSECLRGLKCPISQFTDADPTAWYHDGVHYCIENKIMIGYGNRIFKPDAPITRAMAVVMLWRLDGSKMVDSDISTESISFEGSSGRYVEASQTTDQSLISKGISFQDVASDAWYIDALRWALQNGIVRGYDTTRFGGDDPLTRQQLVTMLYRYVQYKGETISQSQLDVQIFEDYDRISSYALPAIQWAYDAGIIQGMEDGSLVPQGYATRAQVATIFKNYLVD